MNQERVVFRGLGRRKTSVARVMLFPNEKEQKSEFLINKRQAKDYLKSEIFIKDALQPFSVTETENKFHIRVNVRGGGLAGQAGAIRLGTARALLKTSEDYRPLLKAAKFLTQDSRVKERKKPGLRKARKARQFSKR